LFPLPTTLNESTGFLRFLCAKIGLGKADEIKMLFLITNFFFVFLIFAFASLFCFMRNHRCKSRQMIGGAKEFCLDSPKRAQKYLISKKTFFTSIGAPLFSNQSMLGAIFDQIFGEF